SPKGALEQLIKEDEANYDRAKGELACTIDVLDRAIALYIEALQGAYKALDDWKAKPNFKAAMAMAGSALNYILLARHGILLGYYPEARDLLRGCHERITRCYLFYSDDEATAKFFAGEQISQVEVDGKLAKLLAGGGDKQDVYNKLTASYRSSSEVVHPNIESLVLRTLFPEGVDFQEHVGIDTTYGGVMSSKFGETVVLSILSSVRFALKVIGVVAEEGSGKWKDDVDRVEKEADALFEQLKKSTEE
ncbi:hypothetical protein ACFLXT_04415, partial [Chloroflexota bacterium]